MSIRTLQRPLHQDRRLSGVRVVPRPASRLRESVRGVERPRGEVRGPDLEGRPRGPAQARPANEMGEERSAVSGATRCRYCALFHTEAARLFGATDEEVAEASMMGALSMLGSTFINAQQIDYEKFRQETRDIVAHFKRAK